MKIKCPICNEEFAYFKGLSGHLRFKHKLSGEALKNAYLKGGKEMNKEAIKESQQRSQLKLISELHSQLIEAREKRKKVADGLDWFSTDKAAKRLIKLYKREEQRIEDELANLLGEEKQEKQSEKSKKSFWNFDEEE